MTSTSYSLKKNSSDLSDLENLLHTK